MTNVDQLEKLTSEQRDELKSVTEKYAFRCSDYYLSLIDWDDPDDPIRRVVVPDLCELEPWGDIDPSNEEEYTVMPGVEHKYSSTILLLVSNVCESICRWRRIAGLALFREVERCWLNGCGRITRKILCTSTSTSCARCWLSMT